MLHPPTALLVRPRRLTACLAGAGALLVLAGGLDARGSVADADADPALRHGTARQAMDHLDGLRAVTLRLGQPATDPARPPVGQDLKHARTALGADMIALRELARPGEEEAALRGALAALALYQTAWTDLRDRIQSDDAAGADQARAVAGPLGVRAASALASLGHAIDDGNVAAGMARASCDRAARYWNAGLALVAAGLLLLAAARLQGTSAGLSQPRA
ncbi:MAG: hypothetical protein JWO51_888 [Rhodospirillales bacterium]|nr:hypothetical protein [Rhodospirillales bacterium]